MGEYAIRVSDGAEVKIGTCEAMYYLRFQDRDKVRPLSGNVNPANPREAGQLWFRLPFPDEDNVRVGEYGNHGRGLRLYRAIVCKFCDGTGKRREGSLIECFRCHGTGRDGHEDFTDPETCISPGTIQLRHDKSGFMVNATCYHGHKLPEGSAELRPFWNGKGHSLELYMLRCVLENGVLRLYPLVHCVHCGETWRYQWADVWDFIPKDMQERLDVYRVNTLVA